VSTPFYVKLYNKTEVVCEEVSLDEFVLDEFVFSKYFKLLNLKLLDGQVLVSLNQCEAYIIMLLYISLSV